jgi:predicted dehydrogenase
MKPRLAIVGLGAFGELHARTILGLGEAELTAVADTDGARAKARARAWRVPRHFRTVEELCAAQVADAVVIATRTDTHVKIAGTALRHGLHVLVEKPAGRNERELAALARAQQKSGRIVMVDHLCLFHSLVGSLLDRIAASGVRAAHFVRHRPRAVGARFPEESPLTLLMVHDFYVAAQMMGGEDPIHFEITEAREPDGRVDMTWVLLQWRDGRVATFHSHSMMPAGAPSDGVDSTEVFGADFHTRVATNPAPWTWTEEKQQWPIALEISSGAGVPRGMMAELHRAFLRAMASGAVPAGCRISDAAQVQRWTDRLMKRARQKRLT